MYRRCPDCGSSLDPNEVCDCLKEEAAPGVATTKDGKQIKLGAIIAPHGGKING